MDMHHGSVRQLYASFEASPLKTMELSGHNDGNLDNRIKSHPTSEAYAQSTNGIEAKFVNEVNDRTLKSNIDQPIAVIGMALKFPQDATSPEKFWEMLMDGRSARTEVPKDRYNVDSYYRSDSSLPETLNVRTGHFIAQDIAAFDAPFFSINPTEAATIDPQQRLLLETTYEALENAGLRMEMVSGSRTSVYMGSFGYEYNLLLSRDPLQEVKYKATGTALSMASNRLSWFYNLSGSSVTVDTACSSSLTALHLACEDLLHNKSEMSLVGGCNLILTPESSISLGNIGCLSPDGISHSFDHRANGYSRGEGIGVVVIKPLDKALADGDMIRAVIRATGANQDGRTVDIAQPSQSAQTALIRDTYTSAGLSMGPTRYIEAHGTGTPVGDPIEIGSIQSAFKASRSEEDPLFVGAVKSNIGHLEAASGIAGLIKAVLTLEKGIIPGNIWFERANPRMNMKNPFIKFPSSTVPWPSAGLRRASVSSYGFGGANAHIILDDAYHYIRDHVPDGIHKARMVTQTKANVSLLNGIVVTREQPRRPMVFAWSALDESALSRMAETYRDYLRNTLPSSDESSFLKNLAFTLCKKRSNLTWRSCLVADSILDLVKDMDGGFQKANRSIEDPRLAFVFTGQGAQWYAMGRELTSFSRYLQSLQSSQVILSRLGCTWSLLDEMYKEESASQLDNPEYAQPTCLALQIALMDLLESFNVHPTTVIGHSSGEIAAAYAAGALSQESALRIAFSRGIVTKVVRSRQGREADGMMAIALSEQEAISYLDHHFNPDARIWIGCINSPNSVTITGSICHIEFLKKALDADGIFARKLKVDVAYHCPSMQEVALMYEKLVQDLEPRDLPYAVPTMVSTVTGQFVSGEALRQSDHWVRNLVSPVQFLNAINQAFGKGTRKAPLSSTQNGRKKLLDFVLEIGPHSALQGPLREIFQSNTKEKLDYASLLIRGKPATATVPAAMVSLFCLGYPVDLNVLNTRGNSSDQGRLLTSLPSYPFDRSKKYWLEGRIGRNARFSDFPYHDLLGMRDRDWNPLEAKWRSRINRKKRSWTQDHNVLGTTVYPGAGMLVMAIEAARQLILPNQHIAGFRFRDTTITKALVIPSSGDVETNFYLRPDRERTLSSIQRYEFRLCSLENGEWSENCRGSIAVELLESRPIEIAPANSIQAIRSESIPRRDLIDTSKCDISFGTKLLYASLKNIGLEYGPSFRTLTDMFADGYGGAIGSLDLDKWKARRPLSVIQPYVIHPAALDAMFQLPVAARLAIDTELVPMVPTLIRNMWISGGLLDPAPKTAYFSRADREVLLQTKADRTGFRSMNFSFSATNVSSQEPSVYGEVYCTSVVGASSDTAKDVGNELVCFKIASRPELDFMRRSEIEAYCQRDIPNLSFCMDASDQALLVCLLACTQVQRLVSPDLLQGDRAYLRNFLAWINQRADLIRNIVPLSTDLNSILTGKTGRLSELLEKECQQLELKGPTSQLIARSASNILGILTGQLDLLEVFFHDELMDEYYRQDIESTSLSKQTAILVDLMAHKNPSLKILEIGAGTGASTERILDACLCNKGTSGAYLRVAEYTYTDIAPSFLDVARVRFQAFAHSMKFATLDIERDPRDQGFEEGYYDIIIASNVLHATKDIEATLRRAKSLLKRGGKLLLHEAVSQGPIMPGFVFGMFPGWWLSSESERKMSPLLSESRWHDYMLAAGFTGVDVALRDDNIAENDAITTWSSVMISTNPVIIQDKSPIQPLLLIERTSFMQQNIATHIQQKFTAAGYEMPSIIFLDEFNGASYRSSDLPCCISLLEIDRPMLFDIEDDVFTRLRALLTISRGVLWVSNKVASDKNPVNSLFTGLARTVRSENDWLKLCTLSLELTTEAGIVSRHVFDIFFATILHDLIEDVEFVERDGLVHINRATQAPLLNDHIRQRTVEQASQMVSFGQSRSRSLKLKMQTPGLLDSLQFTDHVVPDLVGPDEIEIRVEASGINFRDVLIALGQIDASYLGSECAGVVTQVGKNFQDMFNAGDRVSSMVEGSLRTYARCHAGAACRIPDTMSFSIAASLPIIFATAYYSLHDSAHISQGESILIHSGAGGLGQACIQLAQLSGAEIYATAGTPEKRKFLESFYNIPEDHIFSSRDLTFKDRILEKTQGRGIDVVINSLAGEALRASWEIIAPNGRFIEVGKKDIYSLGALPMFPFAKMATFSSVDLACLFQKSPQIIGGLFSTVLQMYGAGQITEPTPLQIFKGSDIGQAFRLMQNGKSHGKLVIEFNEDDMIPVVPSVIPKYEFDSNATYVLSGGLGGLGRSICRWMISRGAKHFLLLSRWGPQTAQANAFIKEAQRKGAVVVAPACDISNKEALSRTLADTSKYMPPFKGCIQGAMQLCDKRFNEMSFDEFKVPLSSKVDGSWNLHTLLPSGLDFFILLASVSGACGTHGQANYAAANAYQDTLAQYRIAHGESRTWVLDLGNFQSIGHWETLSEELAQAVGAHNYRSIHERELHAALEYYCDPKLPIPSREEAQVIIGLELPSSLNAKGIEDPYWMARPLFKHLYQMNKGNLSNSGSEIASSSLSSSLVKIVEAGLAKASSFADAVEVVVDGLREKLRKTLDMEESALMDRSNSMLVYGVDSLAAVEIRTWFKNVVGADVSVFEILSNTSIEAVGMIAVKRSRHVRIESFGDDEGEG